MILNFDQIFHDFMKLCNYQNACKISSFITYNTAGGKGHRTELFKTLLNNVSDESIKIGNIFELFQSALLVMDDVMDESDTRRGVECYYKKEGMISLKYTQYFIVGISRISRNIKFKKDKHLKSLYLKCLWNTCLGQTLDSIKNKMEEYKLDLFDKIAEYKTSKYTFYYPISIGYAYIGQDEPVNLYEFCRLLGIKFQMQDDYLDFFPEISKKTGTDLETLKLTFFTCKLAEGNSNTAREYFKTGKVTNELLVEIKSFFPEFKIRMNEITEKMRHLDGGINKKVLEFIGKIFKNLE
ncbi:farnesyl pyrophosphate synthase (FPPS) [Vairimorpha necatrix]|uniref:Farnesyl pyrophosphate synthase (FPPS) n=1 Tax=Vairimorpha necatrix TaxID=6039 RepID=A0AAX4JD49_9MICR